ncbi:MAG: metal-dependent hydrolase [Candidatus Aenigmarchaeota archaeon]|nr:metal-dependent hydrolase [Candidatus Aenigmarchaeota archaeon]
MLFSKYFDIAALLAASVAVDIEPFLVLLFKLNYPLHGFFHSFLGGTIVAVLVSAAIYYLRDVTRKIMDVFQIGQRSSFKKILWSSIFGVYLHILLDAPLYADIRPFYPFQSNPLYGLFSAGHIYSFTGISFIIGVAAYVFMVRKNRARKY